MANGLANPSPSDGTIDPGDGKARPRPPTKKPNADDYDGETLERWEPWVRAAIAQQVLLGGLHVEQTANGASVWSVARRGPAGGTPKFAATRFVEILRPAEAAYAPQLALVLSWAELRQERAAEILAQIDNQFPFLASVVYLHPTRTPRTFELLAVAIQMAVNVEMRVKHALGCWRPVEISPQVQPMLTTPGHGSLPSGHATQAYLAAYVLEKLLNLDPKRHAGEILQLQRQAARIATNRVIAGVHYPMDSLAGRALGQALGEYFVCRASDAPPAKLSCYAFDGRKGLEEAVEFHPGRQSLNGKASDGADACDFYPERAPAAAPKTDRCLAHFWERAAQEWTGKFGH